MPRNINPFGRVGVRKKKTSKISIKNSNNGRDSIKRSKAGTGAEEWSDGQRKEKEEPITRQVLLGTEGNNQGPVRRESKPRSDNKVRPAGVGCECQGLRGQARGGRRQKSNEKGGTKPAREGSKAVAVQSTGLEDGEVDSETERRGHNRTWKKIEKKGEA